MVVRLGTPDLSQSLSREATIDGLKTHAERTQEPILDWASERENVAVENRFWLANAVVLTVRSGGDSGVNLDEIARLDGVDELHANFEVTSPEPVDSDEVRSSSDHPATYGLNQINATETWDQFGTMGDGAKVAILDTGIDPTHPDIDLYTENASDPTYPGGWAEFDGDGNQVPGSEPYDSDGHGTHTSGTATGGNASGEFIGVAPEASLIHGGVLTPEGGTFAAIIGGMEWAVEEDADVMSMSLGCTNAPCYEAGMIEPTLNAEAAGTVVVASSGNDGEGMSSSPGNVWDVVAVGASNENANIASFSSGMEVDTDSAWGDDAPSHWPDTYIVPDVSAPGVDVKSSVPGGSYAEYSGTSMSSPHTAGAVALMRSASGGDASVSMIKDALRETAWKPDGEPSGNDTRYGAGIINALEATEQVALEQGVEGTVTDADGNPIEGAEVSLDGGGSGATDAAGNYSVIAQNGTYDVTADSFGYEASTETVTVDGDWVTQDFSLNAALDVEVLEGQPGGIEGGENVSVTVNAANLDSYTASLADGYSEENATLYVNGDEASFGEAIEFDEPYTGEVTVTVETTADTSGELAIEHTFEGMGDSIGVTTGPTNVFEEFTQVGVVDDDSNYGADVADTLEEWLPAHYSVSVLTSDEAIDNVDSYDSFVVQYLDSDNAEAFAEATNGYQAGVVYLDQWGTSSNGIEERSNAIGDPAETGESDFNDAPEYVNVADHPIFEGVGEGPITLHTATFADMTYFSGTDATVLAEVTDGTEQDSGVAVDEDRWDVLGATLGYSTFVGQGDYTDDADLILANMVQFASNPPEPVGTVDVTETETQPGESAEVSVWTGDIDNVSGYQAKLNFDPNKLQVSSTDGQDFADPVVNIDNENGVVTLAQAQASGVDDPTMVDIEFDVLMEDFNQTAEVTWNTSASMVTYENGTAPLVEYTPGAVSTEDCMLGDVNQDGAITVQDATLTQQYIVGEDPDNFNPSCADMNGDGEVTSADVTLILEEIVGSSISAPQPMTVSDLVDSQLQAEA